MSLTRKLLESLDIDSNKVSTIIEAHAETVDALKEQIETAKNEAKANAEASKELEKVQAELDDLKAKGGDWQKKYEDEHNAFEAYKNELTAKEELTNKKSAYRALLQEAGITETALDKIVKLADLKGIELEDGKIKDADKLTEQIKTEWSEFIVNTQTRGARTQTPPKTDPNIKTKEEIMAIKDPSARQKAIAEHLDLFTNK